MPYRRVTSTILEYMLRVIIPLGIVGLGLMIYSLIECLQIPRHRVRVMPKGAWLAVIVLVPIIGAGLWLGFGRARTSSPGTQPRPAAPDDDPNFLRSLEIQRRQRQRADEQRRKEQNGSKDSGTSKDQGTADDQDQSGGHNGTPASEGDASSQPGSGDQSGNGTGENGSPQDGQTPRKGDTGEELGSDHGPDRGGSSDDDDPRH
jgi:hypothetical protein